jgi:hypothetical protein
MALFQTKKQAQLQKPLTLHELVNCNNPYVWSDARQLNTSRLFSTQNPLTTARIITNHSAR